MKILRHSPEWLRAIGDAPDGGKTNWMSAVILYDDASLAHAASRKCREIEQHVETAKIYAMRTVNLNTLPGSDKSQMASTEAASADLVFVCLKPDHQLSRWTQLWMREWASNRSNSRGALIHFCHQENFADWRTTLVREFLETISRLSNLELVEASATEELASSDVELAGLN